MIKKRKKRSGYIVVDEDKEGYVVVTNEVFSLFSEAKKEARRNRMKYKHILRCRLPYEEPVVIPEAMSNA